MLRAMRNRRRLYRLVMARTPASSRPRARLTRSSSVSDSTATLWVCVNSIGSILHFDALDAFAEKRFPGQQRPKQRPLPVVFFDGSGARPRGVRLRYRFGLGKRRVPFDQLRIVVGGTPATTPCPHVSY